MPYEAVQGKDEHEMSPTEGARRESVWAADDLIDMYRESMEQRPVYTQKADSTTALTRRAPPKKSRRKKILIISLCLLAAVICAVAIPVALSGSKKKSSSSTQSASKNASGKTGPTTGTSGSLITMADGTTFTYTNDFDGDWAEDPTNPFSMGGKAQSWSPRVGSEEWVWGTDVARGVNLGGWLVTEPFIAPALYEKYVNSSSIAIVDEWTLSIAMGANLASEMEEHYKTFITEQDFANIAAAGLNWVRIPIGFWAIEALNDEPFLVGTSWTYFLKAIQWARKYGIRIFMDLHALPGSQNGWNHSGKAGTVNFMNGVMGIANAQRTLTYLRILTEFASQDQYRDVVCIIGIVNEILWSAIGQVGVQSFYYGAYEAIRTATHVLFAPGVGAGRGPYIAIHEAFQGPAIWEGFLAGADRVALDQHPYLAFTYDYVSTPDQMAVKPCAWAIATNQSSKAFGVTLGGEFSTAINDCGLWLNGIGSTSAAPNCAVLDDWASYNATLTASLKQVTLATMDALQNFFFWTWKIGNSTVLGTSSSPLWHYQLGLERGWIPKGVSVLPSRVMSCSLLLPPALDPREAIGHCASVLGSSQIFDGTLPASATGAGPTSINADQTSSHVFPPTTLSPSFSGTTVGLLPTYTATGKVTTLFAPTFTAAPTAAVGNGWNNSADTALAFVPVAGCTYPDTWNAINASIPTTTCT
ncbi:exo-beta-1,3-glucanase [Roridomyces roridus]|uniref:glucan 1,3-beta-glucosidase n=1 Tax=Roridomyces roridus TaxID=1738132 RepID=A0AAD7CA73_9AGAR|nr:exo-beta-1,3-glucanase [Roridomyces roridus]